MNTANTGITWLKVEEDIYQTYCLGGDVAG